LHRFFHYLPRYSKKSRIEYQENLRGEASSEETDVGNEVYTSTGTNQYISKASLWYTMRHERNRWEKELALYEGRHILEFIEKDGAEMCSFKIAGLILLRSGK
jgi:hypothetical protein